MKLWDYICELFLFRRLFEKQDRKDCGSSRNYFSDNGYRRGNQSLDDFHEEQDDYDMMDDF